jgi:hypothetical protein
MALLPPRQKKAFHEAVLQELLRERVNSSRQRINPRGVRRKMSNYSPRSRQRGPSRRINFSAAVRIIKLIVLYLAPSAHHHSAAKPMLVNFLRSASVFEPPHRFRLVSVT